MNKRKNKKKHDTDNYKEGGYREEVESIGVDNKGRSCLCMEQITRHTIDMCPNCLGRSTHDIDDLEYKAQKKKKSKNKSKDSVDLFDFEFFDIGMAPPEPSPEQIKEKRRRTL